MSANSVHPNGTDTIVLIHGLWVTALSWEHWIERFRARGYRVLAPNWPGMDGGIGELRRDPSQVGGLSMTELTGHYDRIVRQLDPPPVIIGHCVGGLVVQLLLDRGLGAAGVAIAPAPAKGVRKLPLPLLRAGVPALRGPASWRNAVTLTPSQFHHAYSSTLDERQAAAAYERYHVPGPSRIICQVSLANFVPHAVTHVNFDREQRAPLLLTAGGDDHIFPLPVTRANFDRYRKSMAVTGYKEFPGRSHYTIGEPGWENVADYTLRWAMDNALQQP